MKLIVIFISSIVIMIWLIVYKKSIKWLWQDVIIIFIYLNIPVFL